jgi:bifunctional DNase/RNase
MGATTPCYIARVVMDERHDRQTVTIRPQRGEGELVIVIGQHEALAIERGLHQEHFPRPLTHDLLLDCVQTLGGTLGELAIVREEGGTYFAELRLLLPDGSHEVLDCRPSDGLALLSREPGMRLLVADALLLDTD